MREMIRKKHTVNSASLKESEPPHIEVATAKITNMTNESANLATPIGDDHGGIGTMCELVSDKSAGSSCPPHPVATPMSTYAWED